MNKKDCTSIAYLLSEHGVPQHIVEAFFRLDNRIETEYELFRDVENRSDEVEAKALKYAEEKYGGNWAIRKDGKEIIKESFNRARKELNREE